MFDAYYKKYNDYKKSTLFSDKAQKNLEEALEYKALWGKLCQDAFDNLMPDDYELLIDLCNQRCNRCKKEESKKKWQDIASELSNFL